MLKIHTKNKRIFICVGRCDKIPIRKEDDIKYLKALTESIFIYLWTYCIFCYIFLCMGAIIQANSNQQIIKLPSARYVGTKMKINYNFLYGYCLNCFIPSCLVMRIWCWCKRCKMIILSLFSNCSEWLQNQMKIFLQQTKNVCWSFSFF